MGHFVKVKGCTAGGCNVATVSRTPAGKDVKWTDELGRCVKCHLADRPLR